MRPLLLLPPLLALPLAACPSGSDKETGVEPADTDTDTDTDADTDTDTDTDVDQTWAHCPEPGTFVGDAAWLASVEVTSGAEYCSVANEERTLEQEVAAKAMLKIVGGAYPMPHLEGVYDLAVPVCTRFADATTQPDMAGTGSTEASPNTFGSTTYTYVTGTQPMATAGGAAFTLAHTLVFVGPAGEVPAPLALDGAAGDPSTGAGSSFVLYEDGTSAYDVTARTFVPCGEPDWVRNLHTVTFEGGEVALDLYLGGDIVLTAPSDFARASGTLDGVAFDVTDYFRLFYRPDHHHFGRHFAILFDTPIGDVCALRVEYIDGQEGTTTASVSTAACDLSVTGTRTVTGEGWVLGGE
ncbi:MAG: hypothetical protein V4850_22730 [Myxococcota bacterium]